MKTVLRLIYFLTFVGLVVVAVIGLSGVGHPAMAPSLVWAAVVASLAGASGLVWRRAWPAALVLIPVGALVLLRAQLPVPPGVHGFEAQVAFSYGRLASGLSDLAAQGLPAELDREPGARILLSLAVYGATAVCAFFALSLRRPLPGIVITLAMLGLGMTVDSAQRVLWLPLTFAVLAGCLLALSRSVSRRRWSADDGAAGAAAAVAAALIALLLLGVTSASASKPWVDWRTLGRPDADARTVSFDWTGDFADLLTSQADVPVMRVSSPVAAYWRANALDKFTGTAWVSGSPSSRLGSPQPRYGGYAYRVSPGEPIPAGRTVEVGFDVSALYTAFLFTAGTPTEVLLATPETLSVNQELGLKRARPTGPDLRYTVTSVLPRTKPTDLVGRGREYSMGMMRLIALPFPRPTDFAGKDSEAQWRLAMNQDMAFHEWVGLSRLNRQIVGAATDPYEITLRVEQYLRSHYRYSLTPPRTGYLSPFANFLFSTKTGYCQHFAGAMAALLRFNGIPARLAVGFATGRKMAENTYVVSRRDAHTWVEVYFPGFGWIPFDPTPGNSIPGAGPSSSSAGFIDPFAAGGPAGGTAPAHTPASRQRAAAAGEAGQGAAPFGGLSWLVWVIVPAALLFSWPAGRAAFRWTRLRRGSLEARLRTSVRLTLAELRDHGVNVPPSRTLQETSSFLAAYLDVDASVLAPRVEAVLYGGRRPTPGDLQDLAELRRRLRRRLWVRTGWVTGLLALCGLPVPTHESSARG